MDADHDNTENIHSYSQFEAIKESFADEEDGDSNRYEEEKVGHNHHSITKDISQTRIIDPSYDE